MFVRWNFCQRQSIEENDFSRRPLLPRLKRSLRRMLFWRARCINRRIRRFDTRLNKAFLNEVGFNFFPADIR